MIDEEKKMVGIFWTIEDVNAAIDDICNDDGQEFVPGLTEDEKFAALKELDRYFDNGYAPDYGDLDYELKKMYKDRLKDTEEEKE